MKGGAGHTHSTNRKGTGRAGKKISIRFNQEIVWEQSLCHRLVREKVGSIGGK